MLQSKYFNEPRSPQPATREKAARDHQEPAAHEKAARPYDHVGAIIALECGELDEHGTIELFQYLINTGLAWQLQGFYGRTARDLINAGLCTP